MLDFETDTWSCVRFLEYLVFFRLRELVIAKKGEHPFNIETMITVKFGV